MWFRGFAQMRLATVDVYVCVCVVRTSCGGEFIHQKLNLHATCESCARCDLRRIHTTIRGVNWWQVTQIRLSSGNQATARHIVRETENHFEVICVQCRWFRTCLTNPFFYADCLNTLRTGAPSPFKHVFALGEVLIAQYLPIMWSEWVYAILRVCRIDE